MVNVVMVIYITEKHTSKLFTPRSKNILSVSKDLNLNLLLSRLKQWQTILIVFDEKFRRLNSRRGCGLPIEISIDSLKAITYYPTIAACIS